MIPKFHLKKIQGAWVTEPDMTQRYNDYKATLPDGEYELVLRPKVKWDVAGMRKYLHGPVLEFIRMQCKHKGFITTKDQLKEDFKEMFGKKKEVRTLRGKKLIPDSTSTYDFEDYKKFISDIKDWCKDKLGCDIPDKDEVM